MGRTVEDGFEIYLKKIAPLRTEERAARRHYRSVGACLRARFEGARLVPSGSLGRGTAVRRHSDADYFVVIPRGIISNDSSDLLARVRTALRVTFPRSDSSVSKPAVIVPFGPGGRESLDIVPAVFAVRGADGHYVFDIPDGSGGWIRSSPGAHKAHMAALDDSRAHRVKPLVMLVKAWKAAWNVPIRSFYLEMRVARYAATVTSIGYARGLERVLKDMIGPNGLTDLRDLTDTRNVIRPCRTNAHEREAVVKARRALVRAADARKKEASGHAAKAFERWDLFFNHTFPAYR